MIRHLIQRLPGGKSLAVVLVAAAVAVGGLTMSSVSAPPASAQCFNVFCGYNGYNGYNGLGYNSFGYNSLGYNSLGYNAYGYGYSYPYNSGYSYPYSNGYTYPSNYGYYGYPYSYTSPYSNSIYNNYSSYYATPGVSAYVATPTYTTGQPSIYAGAAPAYATSGSYCMVGSEQVWVPSGASPASYGCSGSSTGS